MRKPVQNSPTADIQKLKIKVGRKPFDQHFGGNDFAACCFHNGDSDHSMHMHECDDGSWC